jgi:hypothetical protein
VRQAVAEVFATPAAAEAFLSLPGAKPAVRVDEGGSTELAEALTRLAVTVGSETNTVSIATEAGRLATASRTVRPRLLAQAIAAWAIFSAIGEVACAGDAHCVERAFEEWDGAEAVADRARRAGATDAQAWRAAELARALLVLAPGELAAAAGEVRLPAAWFEHASIRSATGWHEWQGRYFISAEAWDELVDALGEREALLGHTGADGSASGLRQHAAELRRRAAEAGYAVDGMEGHDGR